MKSYRCHKVVQAEKIASTRWFDGGFKYEVLLESGAVVAAPKGCPNNRTPPVGAFYLVYEDGYTSWSPAEAFEAGYAEIPEGKSQSTETRMDMLKTLTLKVGAFAGSDINAVASDLCELANRTGVLCEVDFNHVKVWARPGDDPTALVEAFYKELEQPLKRIKIAQAG